MAAYLLHRKTWPFWWQVFKITNTMSVFSSHLKTLLSNSMTVITHTHTHTHTLKVMSLTLTGLPHKGPLLGAPLPVARQIKKRIIKSERHLLPTVDIMKSVKGMHTDSWQNIQDTLLVAVFPLVHAHTHTNTHTHTHTQTHNQYPHIGTTLLLCGCQKVMNFLIVYFIVAYFNFE